MVGDLAQHYGILAAVIAGVVILLGLLRAARSETRRHEYKTKVAKRWTERPPSVEQLIANLRKLMRKFEDDHRARIITIIHDIPDEIGPHTGELRFYLSLEQAFEILEQIRTTPKDIPIAVVLHTPGGEVLATELVAAALKDRTAPTTAYVPYMAMSGGTMVALACDRIIMGKHATLGPIDSQFAGFPAHSFQRLLKDKPVDKIGDQALLLAYIVETRMKTANKRARELVNKHHDKDGDHKAVDFLSSGELYHGERITLAQAKELKLNVEGDCPRAMFDMVDAQLKILRRPDNIVGAEPLLQKDKPPLLTNLFRPWDW